DSCTAFPSDFECLCDIAERRCQPSLLEHSSPLHPLRNASHLCRTPPPACPNTPVLLSSRISRSRGQHHSREWCQKFYRSLPLAGSLSWAHSEITSALFLS